MGGSAPSAGFQGRSRRGLCCRFLNGGLFSLNWRRRKQEQSSGSHDCALQPQAPLLWRGWSILLPPPTPKTFTNIIKAQAVGRKALGAHKPYSLGHKADCSSILRLELHLCLKGTSGLWVSHPRDPKRSVRRLSPGSRGAAGAGGSLGTKHWEPSVPLHTPSPIRRPPP